MRRPPVLPILLGSVALAGAGGLCACRRDAAPSAPAAADIQLPPPRHASPAEARLLQTLPPAYRDADLENGALHLNLCRSCHTLAEGGPALTGPNLYGVFGRRVASAPGYDYSAALAARSWTWDAAHLDGWLRSPRTYVPGTKMGFYGITDDADRRDLIAALKLATSPPAR